MGHLLLSLCHLHLVSQARQLGLRTPSRETAEGENDCVVGLGAATVRKAKSRRKALGFIQGKRDALYGGCPGL